MMSFQWMREKMKIILLITVFTFVALIFFDWGMNITGMSGRINYALKINGEEIPIENFQRLLGNNQEELKKNRRYATDDELKKEAYKKTIDDFTKEILLIDAASDLNITVSDKEIVNEIRRHPTFYKDGVFDAATYNRVVRDGSYSRQLRVLEESTKRSILRDKIISYLTSGIVITEKELKTYYLQISGMIKTRHILIKPSYYVPINLAKKEYEENLDKYTELESVQIQHLLLGLPQEATDAQIDEIQDSCLNILAEIKAGLITYDEACYKYSQDRSTAKEDSGLIYQFFTKNDNPFNIPLTDDDIDTAYKKSEELLKLLKEGANFEMLAKKYSDCPSRVRGGDLSWISPGEMDESFEKALYKLKSIGELSNIVETRFGFHIIKLEAIDGDRRRARHILIRPKLSENPVLDEAFKLKVGEISDPVRSTLGFHLIKLKDKKEERLLPFSDVEERIRTILVNDTEVEFAKNEINRLYKLLKEESQDFGELAKEFSHGKTASIGGDLPYFRTGLISERNYSDYDTETIEILQKEIGYSYISRGRTLYFLDPSIQQKILYLTTDEISDTINAQNGYHIFQLIKRKPFDEEEFERFRAELYNDLFEKKQNEIFNQWFEQAK
ncbi:MAG: peptidylprolyl isomerase, partial [Candidatus Hydrogenedentota bacterium]